MTEKKEIAVVIGIGNYNDIGVIRSCGEAGLQVYYLAPDTMVVPVYKSRYVSKWLPTDANSEEEVSANLSKLTKEIPSSHKVSLFPTSDKIAIFIDRLKDTLPQNWTVPCSDKYDIEYLMDKSVMTRFASASGLNPPHSEELKLKDAKQTLPDFPIIVKPLASAFGEKGDIMICRNETEWRYALERFESHNTERLLVQDLICGANQREIAISGVSLWSGEVLIEGYIDKERIFGNGSTIFATYHPEVSNDLKKRIANFISQTGYRGIFDIEMMRNENGDHFIECNFRNGAYGYAVTRGGFNMPAIFAQYGSRAKNCKKKKVVFMEERTDVLNTKNGTLSKREWLKDVIRTDCFLWWNSKDMKPFFSHLWNKLRK